MSHGTGESRSSSGLLTSHWGRLRLHAARSSKSRPILAMLHRISQQTATGAEVSDEGGPNAVSLESGRLSDHVGQTRSKPPAGILPRQAALYRWLDSGVRLKHKATRDAATSRSRVPTPLPPRRTSSHPPPPWLARILCRIGWHDWEVIDVTFGFAPGEETEHLRCRRCQKFTTRSGPV